MVAVQFRAGRIAEADAGEQRPVRALGGHAAGQRAGFGAAVDFLYRAGPGLLQGAGQVRFQRRGGRNHACQGRQAHAAVEDHAQVQRRADQQPWCLQLIQRLGYIARIERFAAVYAAVGGQRGQHRGFQPVGMLRRHGCADSCAASFQLQHRDQALGNADQAEPALAGGLGLAGTAGAEGDHGRGLRWYLQLRRIRRCAGGRHAGHHHAGAAGARIILGQLIQGVRGGVGRQQIGLLAECAGQQRHHEFIAAFAVVDDRRWPGSDDRRQRPRSLQQRGAADRPLPMGVAAAELQFHHSRRKSVLISPRI